MVFVRKSPGRAGATKVQIAERRDGRDVVLEHVGTAHDDAELSALMTVARGKLYPGQGQLDLAVESADGPAPGNGMITGKTSAVLWRVLTSAYTRPSCTDLVCAKKTEDLLGFGGELWLGGDEVSSDADLHFA